jgi:hypothetical protein
MRSLLFGNPSLHRTRSGNSSELSSHEPSETDDTTEENMTREPIYNLPLTVWEGSLLWKIPYSGRGLAEKRYVRIKRAPRNGQHAAPVRLISRQLQTEEEKIQYIVIPPTVVWSNPEKADDINNGREIVLSGAMDLLEGYESRAFMKNLDTSAFPPSLTSFMLLLYLPMLCVQTILSHLSRCASLL